MSSRMSMMGGILTKAPNFIKDICAKVDGKNLLVNFSIGRPIIYDYVIAKFRKIGINAVPTSMGVFDQAIYK